MSVNRAPKSPTRFNRLSPIVQLISPSSTPSTDFPLLIICTWMGASPKLIDKYTTEYLSLFPTTRILLIGSTVFDLSFRPFSSLTFILRPALDVILSLSSSERERLRFVIFSNGGTYSANSLARLYRDETNEPLTALGMVVDSAPGTGDLPSAHRAISVSLPTTPPFSYFFSALLWIFLHAWRISLSLAGLSDPIIRIGDDLVDTTLWKGSGRRVFIFSENDLMVPHQAVRERAKEARERGWDVGEEEFMGSKHVAHVLVDKERYWKVVRETLECG
ncbi:hypothetical protein P7C73_g1911, partial [Tremellales sp. Uapishka_1]